MSAILSEIACFRRTAPIWLYLSHQDIKSRFRRSRLGVLWVVVQQLAFSLGAGVIWSAIFGLPAGDFIPFLTVGFAIWSFVANVMVEGCGAFVIAHGYLKQLPLAQSIFVFRTVATQSVFLLIGLITAVVVSTFFGAFKPLGLLMAIPGMLIVAAYAYGAVGALAYLGLRYRDLQHGLGGVFSLLFVLTPVIYPPSVLASRGLNLAVNLNPFASLIEIVRKPMLEASWAASVNYTVAAGFALVLILLRFDLARRWSRHVPFWS